MKHVVLVNPNTNERTTARMKQELQRSVGAAGNLTLQVHSVTARQGPLMIVDEPALVAAAKEVIALTLAIVGARPVDAVVVGAFGDPGVGDLREQLDIPILGIGEAAMAEAASLYGRFGIATTTPRLAASIDARVHELGHAGSYTGLRLTHGDPEVLVGDGLREQLLQACGRCIGQDGAQAVIIGGGPLGGAADDLLNEFDIPVINAVSAAGRQLLVELGATDPPQ